MKTKKLIVFSGLLLVFLSLSSFKSEAYLHANLVSVAYQDGLLVYATFDGKEDYGYNFITKDKDGEEKTLTFQKVDDKVLEVFNLADEKLIGTKFKITFNRVITFTKDEDGMDDQDETNTITKLEKL
ncbi:hypothetical protein [Algibacter pectinivorans]|uniref:NlpE N-terminal domain-containing protein n=1 Tax=Algibacter pectinivorans TaxID=870482 RepID=A0A1I1MLV8_9FLAO|nr:hypothetical protein [Algibacter pectinivorans]SFC84158.1 hypothetical protein SAMN04487987_101230 [Algibacter pectinivorans]